MVNCTFTNMGAKIKFGLTIEGMWKMALGMTVLEMPITRRTLVVGEEIYRTSTRHSISRRVIM